jgi:hypothetical protein
MKYFLNILLILIFSHYAWADDISSNGLICDIEQNESKRVLNKKLIYHFYAGNVYAYQVSKQNSPITINKILVSKYSYDNEKIYWEGENPAKTIKYYAVVNRLNHILNLEYFFVSGSKTEDSTKKTIYCNLRPWYEIDSSLKE